MTDQLVKFGYSARIPIAVFGPIPTVHRLFQLLDDAERRRLLSHSRQIDLQRGQVLAQAGDACEDVFLVVRGKLRVDHGQTLHSLATTHLLVPGECYCETLLKPTYILLNWLVALTQCEVLALPLNQLRVVARAHPELMLSSLELSRSRTQQLRKQLLRLATRDSITLVSSALAEMATKASDGSAVLGKDVTQSDLAAYVGLSREQVNKKLRELEELGLISRSEAGLVLGAELVQANPFPVTETGGLEAFGCLTGLTPGKR